MIKINDLLDLYEYLKRSNSSYSLYFYKIDEDRMITFKEASKDPKLGLEKCYYVSEQTIEKKLNSIGYVSFINSYKTCCECIQKYLKISKDGYAKEKITNISNHKNYIGESLHILDFVSYEVSFSEFEELQVAAIIVRWCKHNGIKYS